MLGTRWGRSQPFIPLLNPVSAGLIVAATCVLQRPHRFRSLRQVSHPFSWNNKTHLLRTVMRPFGSPEGMFISLLVLKKDLLFSRPYS